MLSGCGTSVATPARAPRPPVAAYRVALATGISIAVPAGWHLSQRMTQLAEPFERFTLASFPLSGRPEGCGPTRAVAAIPPTGALAFMLEYPVGHPPQAVGAAPRPARFAVPTGPPEPYECFGPGWLMRFTAGPRTFQLMVALGPHARRQLGQLLAALDSLQIDPQRRTG
jgi:hypothetical protein